MGATLKKAAAAAWAWLTACDGLGGDWSADELGYELLYGGAA